MSTKTFWIYVDREGKLPQLRHKPWSCASHPYWVRYVNDSPVDSHPYPGQTKCWDYLKDKYVPLPKAVRFCCQQ